MHAVFNLTKMMMRPDTNKAVITISIRITEEETVMAEQTASFV